MTINKDTVTFEPSDLAQFSARLQSDLIAYVTPRPDSTVTVEDFLSDLVNVELAQATKNGISGSLKMFQEDFVKADSASQLTALAFLDQAKQAVQDTKQAVQDGKLAVG